MINTEATISKVVDEAKDVKTIWLKVNEPLAYAPGQFFMLSNSINGEKVKRAYSCANSPVNANHLEFTFDLIPEGKFSTHLWKLKEGETVHVQGPFGKFMFTDDVQNAVLISGGTGCAPMRAMLRYILDKNLSTKAFYLFSAKLPDHLIYKQELDELAASHENVNVAYTVTRLPDDTPWEGERGRINLPMITKHVTNLKDNHFYLCGPPGLVSGIENQLLESDVPKEHIKKEQWG